MKKIIVKFLLCIAIIIAATATGLPQTGVHITINPSPTLYSVMGGGSYCAGQPGVNVLLSGSETGVNYQLLCNGINTGSPIPGTGLSLNFGIQNMGGNYTVMATNTITGCSIAMSNTALITVNPIPSITITTSGSTIFCGSGTVTLTATATGVCTYQWKHNGTPIPGANLNTYVANQTGMFTVIATNGTGCFNDHDTMVQVNPLPQAFNLSSSSPNFCQGGAGVTINQNGSQTGVNYQLMLNGVNSGVPVGGNGLSLAWPNQAAAGVYTVMATDNLTSCTNTMIGSVVLAMNPLPANAGTIIGSTTVCQNTSVSYSTSNILNATSYVWSVPTGATITSGQGTTMIQVDFTGASSGIISVRGHNSCGDGQSTPISVTVNQAPSLNVTANVTDICSGTSANLTANGTGTIFAWSGGGSTQTITVWPTTNTTYSVTVTGPNGCSATGNIAINVHTAPAVVLVLTDDNFCTDVNSAVISGGSPAGGTYTGTCVFGGNTIYPPVSGAGTWVITYTYADGYGCSGSATDLLTINPIPIVMFTNIVGVIYSDTPPFDLMGNVSPIGGTFTGDGMVGSMFSPAIAGPGNHILTYTYVHPFTGCSASQIQYVNVGTVGIDEVSVAANAISIFPNPASTNLNLTGIDTKAIRSLNIINLLGEVVYTTTINAENMVLDVSSLATGSYFIRFVDADGISISKKIMKNE